MKLLTKAQRTKLLANGKASESADCDHKPVVKLFGGGAMTWLISELHPGDPDIAFGLCDLGMGFPELGSVSMAELQGLKFPPFGLGVERDMYWTANKTIGEYADAARQAERIVA